MLGLLVVLSQASPTEVRWGVLGRDTPARVIAFFSAGWRIKNEQYRFSSIDIMAAELSNSEQ